MTRIAAACLYLTTALHAATGMSAEEIRGITTERSLLKGSPTVIVFLSARCPVSNTYGERLQRLYDAYHARGVRFLFLNSNVNESESEILKNSAEHGFTFPVYRDVDSRAANSFGAQATPESFLLDRDAVVRYHGAIDDSQNPARVRQASLRNALDQVIAGVPVNPSETKSFGCTIKRPRKTPL